MASRCVRGFSPGCFARLGIWFCLRARLQPCRSAHKLEGGFSPRGHHAPPTMATLLQPGTVPPPAPKDPLAGMVLLTAQGQQPRGKAAVEITKNALKRIRVAMAKEGISPEQGGLRLGITGGGCSGLSYNIRFDTQPRERDRVFVF